MGWAPCAADPAFLTHLQSQCAQRAEFFEPVFEKRLVLKLLNFSLK